MAQISENAQINSQNSTNYNFTLIQKILEQQTTETICARKKKKNQRETSYSE